MEKINGCLPALHEEYDKTYVPPSVSVLSNRYSAANGDVSDELKHQPEAHSVHAPHVFIGKAENNDNAQADVIRGACLARQMMILLHCTSCAR